MSAEQNRSFTGEPSISPSLESVLKDLRGRPRYEPRRKPREEIKLRGDIERAKQQRSRG